MSENPFIIRNEIEVYPKNGRQVEHNAFQAVSMVDLFDVETDSLVAMLRFVSGLASHFVQLKGFPEIPGLESQYKEVVKYGNWDGAINKLLSRNRLKLKERALG